MKTEAISGTRPGRRRLGRRALATLAISCSFGLLRVSVLSASQGPSPSAAARCAADISSGRQALAARPDDASLELALARSLAACRQYPEAIARYRRVLRSEKTASLETELGVIFERAGLSDQAIPLFRQALDESPDSLGATLGLAQSLAATGNYREALLRYDDALKVSPQNYDALQGKAHVLYWTHQPAAARAIFLELRQRNPRDAQNAVALAAIAGVEVATRPGTPGVSPEESLARYQQRLSVNPEDRSALFGVARAEAELKNFPAAVASYRRLVAVSPDDRDAQLRLALALSWNREYAESIRRFHELLKQVPTDSDALQGLAHASFWAGDQQEALAADEKLLAQDPSNPDYQLAAARAKAGLRRYRDAQQSLLTLLSLHSENRAARLELGQVYLKQRHWGSARKQFEAMLELDPHNRGALFDGARCAYYEQRLGEAYALDTALLRERPTDFDALMLLARIDRARGDRRRSLEALSRADRLSPGNAEAQTLRDTLAGEPPFALETVASYVREIGRPVPGSQAGLEDLRSFAYGSTFSFTGIPHSQSHLALSYLPLSSPSGVDQGAVAPAEFEYSQATRPIAPLTLRAGIGLARFGPGAAITLPASAGPQPGAASTPIGFVGGSFALDPAITFDLTWSRSAILYTPLTVRLGVTSNRTEAGVSLKLDPRSDLRVSYFGERDTSERYPHFSTVINPNTGMNVISNAPQMTQGTGGAVLFNHRFKRSGRFALDGGYWGLAYGYDAPRRGVFLGFFTPSLYERHLLTARASGKVDGRLGYDFSAGFGVQQIGARQALTRAVLLNPALTLKATGRLSFTLGYTFYNVAQTLGLLSGNGVRLTTDWRF